MNAMRSGRVTMVVLLAAAMLAGCGATSMAPSIQPTSRVAPESSGQDLVYVSEGKTIGIYSISGQQVGALKGFLEGAKSLCSDSQGNVWVAYGDSFLEYAHGGTTPIAQVYLPYNFYAVNCAVDPTTGDFAASVTSEDSGSNVVVYQNIYESPQTYSIPSMIPEFLAYDSQGNLFVNGAWDRKVRFAELLSGTSEFQSVSPDEKFLGVGGLAWDGQYFVVGDSYGHVVYQMSVSGGRAITESTTHFFHWKRKFKTIEPFGVADGLIVLPYTATDVGYFNFPKGGKPVHKLAVYSSGGVTISVSPSHAGPRPAKRLSKHHEPVTRRSWIKGGSSSGPLIYASANTSNGSLVLLYSYPQGEQVGTLATGAGGMCSDSNGNVFMTARNAVTEYAHGGTTPLKILRIPGAEMFNCSIDPTTNNLAVTMRCYVCGYTDLAIFADETGTPQQYQTGDSAWTCGYDGSGNLFCNDSSTQALRELPAGSSTFITVTFNQQIGDINQIQWDGQHVTLQNLNYPGYIYPIDVSGSVATILPPTKFRRKIYGTSLSWIYDHTVVFGFLRTRDTEPPDTLGIWKYPLGGHATKLIKKTNYRLTEFGAVTVSAPVSPSDQRRRSLPKKI